MAVAHLIFRYTYVSRQVDENLHGRAGLDRNHVIAEAISACQTRDCFAPLAMTLHYFLFFHAQGCAAGA
jgi:hypothetical protein